ncbi:MAG: hypothetical protein JKY93_08635 [Gammaproteobacteria bacterium]|nr:hypothetical protein [Gammaproteobacteria bacterium]
MNQLLLKNGNIYLDSELYETYFSAINSVVLIKKESLIQMLPVQQAGGGLLLKIKNAKGDRIVHATEFFQQHGLEIEMDKEILLDAKWNAEMAALTFSMDAA